MHAIAPLAVAIPLVVAAGLAATTSVSRRAIADAVTVATAVAVAVLCAILLSHTLSHDTSVTWLGGWRPRHSVALGISLTVDTMGAGLATLVAVLVCASTVFSVRYFDAVGNLYHALMLVFLAAMVGFALTGDLFNMFVFYELLSVAAYSLTAYKIEERGPLQGAINFAITNSVGAFMVLMGIALMYARTGALNLAQIGVTVAHQRPDMLLVTALLLITFGFMVKAGAVPVHFWSADAHAVAPIPVCVLLSGVMVPLGVYAIARVWWTVFSGPIAAHAGSYGHALIWVGVVTAAVGAVMCVSQRHLKRLLAFSSVSHVGIFIIGVGLLTDHGLAGTAMYAIAHGLTKGGLFMCVGVLLHRFLDVDEHSLRGRGYARDLAPVGLTMAVGGLVLAATPMTGTFFGKSLLEETSLEHGYAWLPTVLTAASALTGGAVLRASGRIFLGLGHADPPDEPEAEQARHEEGSETRERHHRTPLIMVVPPAVMIASAVVVGLVPGVVHAVEHAAAHFRDRAAYSTAVLSARPAHFAPGRTSSLTATDFLYGSASVVLAFTVAMLGWTRRALLRHVPEALASGAGRAWWGFRSLHSGHVGDYVTWLTVGLAALGGAFALALR